MKFQYIATAIIAASLASAASAQVFTGTTVGGTTFNRPVANGVLAPVALSGTATAVRFSVLNFSVGLSGTYTIQSTSVTPANWDNYTFLYQNSFNSASPLTNIVIGNDDNFVQGLSGFSKALSPGINYFLVTTENVNSVGGSFSNSFSGPAIVQTPEPGSLALLGLGFLPAAALLRRRRK